MARFSSEKIVRLIARGLSAADVARKLGCHRTTVYAALDATGTRLPGWRSRAIDPAEVRALQANGLNVGEIARELHCSRHEAVKAINRANREAPWKDLPQPWEFVCTFPDATTFTPDTKCDHDSRPYPAGSRWYCPVCDRTAWDHHPKLQGRPLPLDPRTKLAPSQLAGGVGSRRFYAAPEPERLAIADATAKLTRRERRQLKFASREAAWVQSVLSRLAV